MSGLSGKGIAVLVLWPIAASLLTLCLAGKQLLGIDNLRGDIEARPPIAVVDVDRALYSQFNGGPADPATLTAAQKKLEDAARKLRGAGYIVIDSRNLYAYPKDFEAQP